MYVFMVLSPQKLHSVRKLVAEFDHDIYLQVSYHLSRLHAKKQSSVFLNINNVQSRVEKDFTP